MKVNDDIQYKRMPDSPLYLTGYDVIYNGKLIGQVFKKRSFSYRGSQGWNSGIRLHDFHPIQWNYSKVGETREWWAGSRKAAAEHLINNI